MSTIRSRRPVATAAGAVTGLALSVPDLGSSAQLLTGADAAAAFSGLVVIALAALSLWLLVASTLVAIAARTGAGTTLARRVAPAWLAASLSTGALLLSPGAHASPTDLDGLPLPDRTPFVATADPPDREPAPVGGTVVVQSGDCLWDLARAHAGTTASSLDVARLTTAWYETNRAVIGADPDVLLPGQVLTVPVQDRVAP